jgi:hypothetical protein
MDTSKLSTLKLGTSKPSVAASAASATSDEEEDED